MQTFAIAVAGLVVGSFLGLLSTRMPKGEQVSKGRSRCDHCRRKIAWFDNLPLISYFLLKGKCRWCQRKISSRYPLIEAATAGLFVSLSSFFRLCPDIPKTSALCLAKDLLGPFSLPLLLVFFSLLMLIFVIDLETKIIPDNLSLFLTGFLLFVLFIISPQDLYHRLFSGFVLASFLMFLHLATRGKGMGMGDIKLTLPLGFLLGLTFGATWLLVSFVLGGLVGSLLLISKKAKLKDEVAFGPFLVAGFFLTAFFGRYIVRLITG